MAFSVPSFGLEHVFILGVFRRHTMTRVLQLKAVSGSSQ